jgi:hypothetical protein
MVRPLDGDVGGRRRVDDPALPEARPSGGDRVHRPRRSQGHERHPSPRHRGRRLRRAATALLSVIRVHDTAAHPGGDEFALLAAECASEDVAALRVARDRRIRRGWNRRLHRLRSASPSRRRPRGRLADGRCHMYRSKASRKASTATPCGWSADDRSTGTSGRRSTSKGREVPDLRFCPRAPGRTRTCDPLLRRQPLYPAELQGPRFTLQRGDSGGRESRRPPSHTIVLTGSAARMLDSPVGVSGRLPGGSRRERRPLPRHPRKPNDCRRESFERCSSRR